MLTTTCGTFPKRGFWKELSLQLEDVEAKADEMEKANKKSKKEQSKSGKTALGEKKRKGWVCFVNPLLMNLTLYVSGGRSGASVGWWRWSLACECVRTSARQSCARIASHSSSRMYAKRSWASTRRDAFATNGHLPWSTKESCRFAKTRRMNGDAAESWSSRQVEALKWLTHHALARRRDRIA